MAKVKKLKVKKVNTSEEKEEPVKRRIRKDTPELIRDILMKYSNIKSYCDLVDYQLTNDHSTFKDVMEGIRNTQKYIVIAKKEIGKLRQSSWRDAMFEHTKIWEEELDNNWEKALEILSRAEETDE